MRLQASISVEDPGSAFHKMARPEFTSGVVKHAVISLAHESGWTRFTLAADDPASARAGVSAIMNAFKVYSDMSEVCSHGNDTGN